MLLVSYRFTFGVQLSLGKNPKYPLDWSCSRNLFEAAEPLYGLSDKLTETIWSLPGISSQWYGDNSIRLTGDSSGEYGALAALARAVCDFKSVDAGRPDRGAERIDADARLGFDVGHL